jgi:hypothetical protein
MCGARDRGPVRAVSVVSTGTVEIHPEPPDGASKPLYWWLLTSRRWTPPPPINAYIIEHAKGLILREDHLGGLAELGGANLLVAAAERDQLSGFSPALRGLLRKHLTIPGVQWHQIGFEPTGDPGLAPPLLRLRGRAGRRSRSPPQPQVSLPLRRPERGAAQAAPSSAQGWLPILSVCAQAWEAPSPRAVPELQSDNHARRSRRSGAGARQAPAESRLYGVWRPLRRSPAPGMQLQDIRVPDMGYEQVRTAGPSA